MCNYFECTRDFLELRRPWGFSPRHDEDPREPFMRRQGIFQSEKWESLSLSDSLRPHGLYSPWNSPGRNTSSKPTTRQDGFILQDTPLQGHSEPLGVLSPDPGVRSLCPPLKDADGEVSPSLTPLPPGWLLT